MVIEPKVRGFICVTTHPTGCEANVKSQIDYVKSQPAVADGPKKVLVIGASTGYGLASRISAAFGSGAATLGVFFEKPGTEKRPGSAGWYNTAAFTKFATEAGLYARNVNADAFSDECREQVIKMIKEDLGQVDLVVYSLASPVRKVPSTGEVVRSCLKPIGKPYVSTAIDTNKDTIIEATVEPATDEEVQNTVTVMGGQDWELWMNALKGAGVLAEGCKTVAYSYIGTEITWPIYWHGALGKAKEDLDRAALAIRESLQDVKGDARVAVLKSVVTQASSAIPVMPLYIALCFRVMREQGIHESVIEHIYRMFATSLYGVKAPEIDAAGRVRMDSWELRDSVQLKCKDLWAKVTTENLKEITDYEEYKHEFLQLFGFEVDGVDYSADVNPVADFDCVQLV
ncbi:MAG: enoyl-ACP reductase FabV [Anaerobiospirillum succiniciproducens]|uniref:enoyl-ACP reductase FabV n=1 Tax=Anaerobiospirillum succiniciproducens TaxID=13335 RepID=UPI0004123116|nr:enoyl-ACP reductase FabV [Anaerobiospirillum succiniciproducens]MDO4675179.1 trans-2-enoyl-CoA reductase family protein [Anaerobiospirillum succiniciproducens]MDY2798607.1 enoyl-ACP reductase FabV [Anaerobiospirillum succiniciproducens]